MADAPPMDRIRKLVALASSPEDNEARTAAHLACKLIREHNVVLLASPATASQVRVAKNELARAKDPLGVWRVGQIIALSGVLTAAPFLTMGHEWAMGMIASCFFAFWWTSSRAAAVQQRIDSAQETLCSASNIDWRWD